MSKIHVNKEQLAELCHEQWSGWMKYLFSKCDFTMSTVLSALENGSALIPKELVDRWARQMNTEYKNLSGEEKESDRAEADKFLTLILGSKHV